MNDVLEQTHPPGFRCSVHEDSMLKIERRLTALETGLAGVKDGQDRMEKTMRTGFNEIKDQLNVQANRESSLNSKIQSLQMTAAKATGAVGLGRWAIPIIITLGCAVVALVVDVITRILG